MNLKVLAINETGYILFSYALKHVSETYKGRGNGR